MAHRGVVVAGSWELREDIGVGVFFREDTGTGGDAPSAPARATAQKVEKCTVAGEIPLGVIRYSQKDGQKSGDLLEGHYAGPPSEIIEVKLAADVDPNGEIVVSSNGEAAPRPTATSAAFPAGTYRVIGFIPRGGSDGDIAECQVRPRDFTLA